MTVVNLLHLSGKGQSCYRIKNYFCTSPSDLIADVFELLHHVRVHGGHIHGADDKSNAVHPVGFSWMILVASLAPVQATVRKLQRLSDMCDCTLYMK